MNKAEDQSLGDLHTYDGGARDTVPKSLGDEMTMGGGAPTDDSLFDDDMEVVDLFARYTIEGELGKGGMGEVLLATDTRLERKVAIKRILGEGARSRTAVSRFLTEAKSIAALNHQNIVQIYDYGRDKDGPFLIMEFVEGNSLLERCQQGPVPPEEAVELTCQLCDGLGMAHDANIIHRDIKPANVLLTKTGTPKLTDFGLAKDEAADTGLSVAGAVLGTLDFMPPEQRKDSALTDSRSDLWSLAATLYQLVSGESPRVIDLDAVPLQLRQTLARALKTKKDDRYQSVREFRDALRGCWTVTEPVSEVPVDLGAGECPQCHEKNEAARKFCRECAASLRVECLNCAEAIPVWDKVCAECGGKQAELVDSRCAAMDAQREQAESLCHEKAFGKSLDIAREIAAIQDSRLQHLQEWSEAFISETETEKARQEQNAADHHEEAQTHREAYDYKSAIHALEAIPEPMRTDQMSSYLQQLQSDHDESVDKISVISDQVKRRDLDGLFELVSRAVELRGDREDLQKLQKQLSERRENLIQQRDAAYVEAQELMLQGTSKAALALVESVRLQELTPSQQQLKQQLKEMEDAEAKLTLVVKEAKADGTIEPEEVWLILSKAVDYLKLNPNHVGAKQLKDDLLTRIRKDPERHAACSNISDEMATLAELPPARVEDVAAPVKAEETDGGDANAPTHSGVPDEVVKTLKTRAAREHRDDHEMQEHELQEQIEAYLEVQAFQVEGMPGDVLKALLSGARKEHRNDYSMQLYTLQEEVEAYAEMQTFDDEDIPDDILKELLSKARKEHRGDYGMQLYTVKEEAEAYTEMQSFSDEDTPGDVLKELLSKARKEHRGDYGMQLFTVKEELEAYAEIQTLDDEDIPGDVLKRLLSKARKEHRGDYGMQLYTVKEELEEYRRR